MYTGLGWSCPRERTEARCTESQRLEPQGKAASEEKQKSHSATEAPVLDSTAPPTSWPPILPGTESQPQPQQNSCARRPSRDLEHSAPTVRQYGQGLLPSPGDAPPARAASQGSERGERTRTDQ